METLELTEFQRKMLAFSELPNCWKCKMPTPDEFCDPFFWEAGERVCDNCGKAYRPGPRPHRARVRRKDGPITQTHRRDETGQWVKIA